MDALPSVNKAWEASPEFLKLRPEFPAVELTSDATKGMVAHLMEQPEAPAKHFLLTCLDATMSEAGRSDGQWKSFQDDFSRWQKTSNATPKSETDADPCKTHRYSRCVASLQARTHLTDAALLLLGKAHYTLQQYDRAATVLARVQGESNENACSLSQARPRRARAKSALALTGAAAKLTGARSGADPGIATGGSRTAVNGILLEPSPKISNTM